VREYRPFELFPRQGVERAHRLQGLGRLPERPIEGADRLPIRLAQALPDGLRNVGFDGPCQAGQAFLFRLKIIA
jgi:hypothetical protein